MKHICMACEQTMQTTKIGITAIEYQDKYKSIPYRLWRADLKECASCPNKALNFADKPTESFHEGFEAEVKVARESEDTIHFY